MNDYKYLTQRVEERIAYHEARARGYQRLHRRLQVALLAVAAAIPVLCGLMTAESIVLFRVAIGVFGIAAVVIAAIDGLNRYPETALESRRTAEALRYEQFCYRTGNPPYDGEKPLAILVDRVESILAGQHDRWRQQLRDAPAEPDAEKQPSVRIWDTAFDRQ